MTYIKEILGFSDIICGVADLTTTQGNSVELCLYENYTQQEFKEFFDSLFKAIEERDENRKTMEVIDWLISDEEFEKLEYFDDITSTIWSKHGWATLEEPDNMIEPCWIFNIPPEIPDELKR